MTDFTYSITITHYNNPELLSRMLGSVPERDDIQVIVVDDGSTEINKKKLLLIQHKNLELILLPKNEGGGNARNIGLKAVKGKWLIAVDCDDSFAPKAWDEFDKYANMYDKIDYIAYFVSVRDSKTMKKLQRLTDKKLANDSVKRYYKNPNARNLSLFKFLNTDTWNKMVSMRFIQEHDIKWENCRVNIDVYYSFMIGIYGKNFEIIPKELYYAFYDDENSITRQSRSLEKEFQFYLAAQKRNGFYECIGLKKYPFYRTNWMYILHFLKKRGVIDALRFMVMRIRRKEEIAQNREKYKHLL